MSHRVAPSVRVLTDRRFLVDVLERCFSASSRDPQSSVDVLLIDAAAGPATEEVVETLAQARSLANLLVVVGAPDDSIQAAMWLELGVQAVLTEADTFGDLLDVVDRLQRGESIMGVSVREGMLSQLRLARQERAEREALFTALTRRESQVLRELARGSSPEDVARSSFVSLNTVRTQIRGILAKLDVSSVVAAVAFAYRSGWIESSAPSSSDVA
jgi:two-component system, NarL family, nitrate/nitrite response regulator NarL